MAHIKFFDTPEAATRLTKASAMLTADPEKKMDFLLGKVLEIIRSNAPEFDECCQVNIDWIGDRLISWLAEINVGGTVKASDNLVSTVYRFVVEFDISVKYQLSMELRAFMAAVVVAAPQFESEPRAQVEFARQDMAVAIVKRLLNSEEIGSLKKLPDIASSMEQKLKTWNKNLSDSEQRVTKLSETLTEQMRGFNFVQLHDAFHDLSKHMESDLEHARRGLWAFGSMMLVPSVVDLLIAIFFGDKLTTLAVYSLVAVLIGSVTVTLLFLYFFRISLRKADSCRAQLVQVRLRMSLCRFIQGYADYSAEFKAKNADALSKFEALIFSGIVGTEEKLPATFDGLEQLGALAKSLRGS